MADIQTIWDVANGRGDWQLVGTDLVSGSDLETAVLISLFTDAQAQQDDIIPDGSNDPRGWWGDLGQPIRIGSRLWLLDRAKQTNETLQRAENYASEALQWLVTDGVIASFNVVAQWVQPAFLGVQVTLYEQSGNEIPLNYAWAWKELS